MSRLDRLIARLPVGDATRRAWEETAADWSHERRHATSLTSRVLATARACAGISRIVVIAFRFFEEPPMRHLGRDASYAMRRLRNTPGFTLFSIVSLALGIGVTTGVYSVIRAATAPPSGIRDVPAIVNISHQSSGGMTARTISKPDFLDLRARQSTMTDVTAWRHVRLALTANDRTSSASFGEIVSGNYFAVLGVPPEAGRLLQPADEEPGAARVIVLGHRTWQQLFDGRADAVGQSVLVNGVRFDIVGVAPRTFKGLFNNGLAPSVGWVPLGAADVFPESGVGRTDRGDRSLLVRGRIAPGRSLEQVAAEVAAIGKQLDLEHPMGTDVAPEDRRRFAAYRFSRAWAVQPMTGVTLNDNATNLVDGLVLAVMLAMALVLMVACTSLANLMLARGVARRQEQAVRIALGATRWRLVREGTVETLIIVSAAGIVGLGVARIVLVAIGQDIPMGGGFSFLIEPHLDLRALVVALAAGTIALVVAGLVPSWHSSRTNVRDAIAQGASNAALPRWRGRRLLITGQVAVSVVFVAIASLFMGQLVANNALDGGYDLDRIAVAEVAFGLHKVDDARRDAITDTLLARLRRTPGIETAAASLGLPVGITTAQAYVSREEGGEILAVPRYVAATPSIFHTLGVTLVRGRLFDVGDITGGDAVAVMTETTARALFGRTDVVGQQIVVRRQQWVGGPEFLPRRHTIIGLVEAADAGSVGRREGNTGVMYVPLARDRGRSLTYSIRTAGDPADLVGELRAAIAEAAPDVSIEQIGTGRRIAGPDNLFGQITAGISGMLGGFSLVLALVGLYGVLSHVVAHRTREIGVRLALGGTPGAIVWLVLRQGMSPVVLGVLAGAALSMIARLSLQPMFERLLPAADGFALGVVPTLLIAAGALACYLPARRAAAVDPSRALNRGT